MKAIHTTDGGIVIKASAQDSGSEIFEKEFLNVRLGGGCRHAVANLHALAARMFANSRGWTAPLATGPLPGGNYAHCFVASTTVDLHDERKIHT